MQQTRIEQGSAYYLKFVEKYPTIQHLASAPLDEVMLMWEGLGYYTRARNLHKAAQYIVEELNGVFPESYNDLLSLPGIGPYSAAAISSFAYGHRHVVVDGNVKRLISRYIGITDSIDEPATHETIRQVAFDLMKGVPPDAFNQAIMNFGALICKPKPSCQICPLASSCYAFKHNITTLLPVRTKKKLNRERFFHFIILHYRGKMLFERRQQSDIWKGLYAPPVLEHASLRSPSKKKMLSFIEDLIGTQHIEPIDSDKTDQQILSHQTIIGRYHHFRLLNAPKVLDDSFLWVNEKSIQEIGKPKMIVSMVKDYKAS